jgi:hypothetical protein
MVRFRRLRMPLVAGACLIAGFAIGLTVPRGAHMTSPGSDGARRLDRSTSLSPGRNVFSPDIRHDEYVRREQLKIIEMLEQQCRATREHCELAKASRESLTND